MDTKEQVKVMTGQFVSCFNNDDNKLAIRIVLFILTGLCALWFYIVLALFVWVTEMLQVVGRELYLFVSNENRSSLVRSALLFVAYPVTVMRYCLVPFMFMVLFLCNFFFNCFAFTTSLGKSGWQGLQINK